MSIIKHIDITIYASNLIHLHYGISNNIIAVIIQANIQNSHSLMCLFSGFFLTSISLNIPDINDIVTNIPINNILAVIIFFILLSLFSIHGVRCFC